MKLNRIEISNFKGLKNVFYEISEFSCFVGENNAGKSSLLQAVNIALTLPASVPESFYYEPGVSIKIVATYVDIDEADLAALSEEQREKLEPHIADNQLTLALNYVETKLELKFITKIPINRKYRKESYDKLLKGKPGEFNPSLKSEFPEWLDMPTFKTQGDARTFIEAKIAAFDNDQLTSGEVTPPTGMPAPIRSMLPEAIYIQAVKDFSDDMKVTTSSTFGRLIALLLEDLAGDIATFADKLEGLKKQLNRIYTGGVMIDERLPKVRSLETLVEKHLQSQFPKARVELEIPPPEIKTILSSARIFIDDGSRDLIDNKGDGIKRSLIFSLIRVYVEQLEAKRAAAGAGGVVRTRPLMFLFEEPELYLHPKSQIVLFQALSSISKQHPVMVTTHSPIFFAPGVTASFVRVKKEPATPKPIGTLHPVRFSLDAEKSETFQLAIYKNAEAAFFCSKVVLFEGDSDEFYLKHISRMLNPDWDFDRENIGLVRVGGKGSFKKFREFFEAFGMEVSVIADLDVLLDGFEKLGPSNEAKQVHQRLIQLLNDRVASAPFPTTIRSRQLKDAMSEPSWKHKYMSLQEKIRVAAGERAFNAELCQELQDLFKLEENDKKYGLLQSEPECQPVLNELLNLLRDQGVCVLRKGDLEEYYPTEAPRNGSKPARALAAIKLITNVDSARAVSVIDGRPESEFELIFGRLFRAA